MIMVIHQQRLQMIMVIHQQRLQMIMVIHQQRLQMIMVIHQQRLQMIMVIHQQRLQMIMPLYQSESPLGNNTANVQGEDLVNIILTLHNQERAAVGVPPLTWSDSLAAHAQPWADKVYETGDSSHSSGVADFGNYGENMAWGGGPSFATPTWLLRRGLTKRVIMYRVLPHPIALVITHRWLTSNQPRLVAGLLVDPLVNMLNMVERMYWFVNTLLLATGITNHHIRMVSPVTVSTHPSP